ncbi:UNVERIFIED_CONTAM: hypothetical protein GTU68_031451 [Idotea baltica]|nr:hypothetical protein [Idotea baltica]
MRIPRFYCPDLRQQSELITLPAALYHHAIQVLRLKAGATISLFDGQGSEFRAELHSVDKRSASALLTDKITTQTESPLTLTLFQGISRGDRMDYTLQKAVELGVQKIVPVITARCNVQLSGARADKKTAHWQGVVISACEQSGRIFLPELAAIQHYETVLTEHEDGMRLILDPTSTQGFNALTQQSKVSLLIGPEGGFDENELQQATASGFQAIRFGPRILRTETAAVAALAALQTLWGDLG